MRSSARRESTERTSTIRSPARKPAARAGPSGSTRVTSQAPLRNSYSKPSDMPARDSLSGPRVSSRVRSQRVRSQPGTRPIVMTLEIALRLIIVPAFTKSAFALAPEHEEGLPCSGQGQVGQGRRHDGATRARAVVACPCLSDGGLMHARFLVRRRRRSRTWRICKVLCSTRASASRTSGSARPWGCRQTSRSACCSSLSRPTLTRSLPRTWSAAPSPTASTSVAACSSSPRTSSKTSGRAASLPTSTPRTYLASPSTPRPRA